MNYLTIGLLLASEMAEETNKGPDFGKASPIGLLVVVLLLLGVFFLVWSMNRHLKRLPASFDTEPETASPSDSETPPRESTG